MILPVWLLAHFLAGSAPAREIDAAPAVDLLAALTSSDSARIPHEWAEDLTLSVETRGKGAKTKTVLRDAAQVRQKLVEIWSRTSKAVRWQCELVASFNGASCAFDLFEAGKARHIVAAAAVKSGRVAEIMVGSDD